MPSVEPDARDRGPARVSLPHPDLPGVPRLVVDTGVFVAAAISGKGAPDRLLWLVTEQRASLVVSPLLVEELGEVLARQKFRRWISQQDADAYVESLQRLARTLPDPPEEEWVRVCRDPDDDYLVALTASSDATILVSGDRDLLEMDHPGTDVRKPRDAVDALEVLHPWGPAVIPADDAVAWRQVAAEGGMEILTATSTFISAVQGRGARRSLRHVVTPESLTTWRRDLAAVRAALQDRGMATRPEHPAPGVAYVKLPPDPGRLMKATGELLLQVVIVTLQQRLDLPHHESTGGWRVHAVGNYVLPEDLPG